MSRSNQAPIRLATILLGCSGVLLWHGKRHKQRPRPSDANSCIMSQHSPLFDKSHLSSSSTFPTTTTTTTTRNNTTAASFEICSHIPIGKTASSIWRQHLADILKASMHKYDNRQQIHQNWTRQLLQLLPPSILQRGIRVSPNLQHGSPWHHVMTKIGRKLQHPQDPSVPAVQIAIFGGSVTEGRDCERLPWEVGLTVQEADNATSKRIIGRTCSWPDRLQSMIDLALGMRGIVFIHNLAVGGTGTPSSQPIIQHWLYPGNSPLITSGEVDVIVNAYATNDNLPLWNRPKNTTVDRFQTDRGRNIIQQFLQTCRMSQPCRDAPPLILYLDDYVGNQGDVLLGEMQVNDVTQEMGQYGNGMLGHVSSMNALWRPFILPNTSETLLSAKWIVGRVEVHFGMPGHIARSWIFAFALLQWTVNYCQDQRHPVIDNHMMGEVTNVTSSSVSPDVSFPAHASGQDESINPSSRPQESQANLFDPRTKALANTYEIFPYMLDMRVVDVARIWNTTVQRLLDARPEQQCDDSNVTSPEPKTSSRQQPPCTFAFVAAPMGTHSFAGSLNDYVSRFASIKQNWTAKDDIRNGWHNKLGLVAQAPGARLVLHFPNITKLLKVITVHYLQSYGEAWQNSTANFTISITRRGGYDETRWQLLGYHDQETSIADYHVFDLGRNRQAQPGDTVDLEIELVGGSTFKILSLLLCNR